MGFDIVLGLKETNGENIRTRTAIRAIIKKDGKILMVRCNKGDYKFPGGGLNKVESHEDTLRREVQEETGYILSEVKEKLGVILERSLDSLEEGSVFEMASHYYLCEISDRKTKQNLDAYEAELEFEPVWISIDKAIEENSKVLHGKNEDMNQWVYRETMVLKELV